MRMTHAALKTEDKYSGTYCSCINRKELFYFKEFKNKLSNS